MRIIYCVFNGGLTTFDLAEFPDLFLAQKPIFVSRDFATFTQCIIVQSA